MTNAQNEQKTAKEELTRVLELPSDDRVPLVEFQGKVTVRSDPLHTHEQAR
jgi:hypothetical protein